MTVTASTAKSGPYAGAGTTGPFTVAFRFLENSHLQVIRTSAAGIDTTLTLTSQYTVSGAGASSGTVTLSSPLLAGEKLTIIRSVPLTQEADYVQNDAFPAESHERALDKLTMEVQQVAEVAGRALALPASTTGVSPALPAPEANKVLGWNNAASGLQNFDVQSLASVVAYGTADSDIFTGNGSQTQFVLSANPGVLDNLDVSVNGLTYLPGLDYTWAGGTTVTFSVAPAIGDQVLIRYMQALAIGTADSSLVQYTPAGAGAVARTAQAKLRESVSVLDFGAVGDGVTDDTAAINAAIASLPAAGGLVYFPPGRYACNITITKNGVTLRGAGLCDWRNASNFHGLIPFVAANPVVTVGNDTGYVTGVRLENLSIASPDGLGMCGLKLFGGAYGFQADGLHIVGFRKYCLWAQNGATYPVTYSHFNNFTFSTGPSASIDANAAAVFAYYATGAGSAFTTALFFNGGQIVFRTAGARAFWLDGVQVYGSNIYIEAGGVTRQGLKFAKTYGGAQAPIFFGENVTIDSDTGSSIVVEGHLASLFVPDYVRGKVNLDGLIENNAAATVNPGNSQDWSFYAQLLYANVQGSLLFPDPSSLTDTTAQIYGSGAAGARRLNIAGDRVDIMHGALGLRLLSPAASSLSRFFQVDSLNGRTSEIRNSGGELQIIPTPTFPARIGDGAWNGSPMKLGNNFLWVDSTTRLRIKASAPTSDTDGTVVGTQV